MAQAAESGGGGRIGPYWRRQLGMTGPGEYTQEQLKMVNQLRKLRGQPPLGGAPQASPVMHQQFPHQAPLQQAVAQPHPMPPMGGQAPVPPTYGQDFHPMPGEQPGGNPLAPALAGAPAQGPQSGGLMPLPNPQLPQMQRRGVGTSRAALFQYLKQMQGLRAQPMGHQRILPQRPPLKRAVHF